LVKCCWFNFGYNRPGFLSWPFFNNKSSFDDTINVKLYQYQRLAGFYDPENDEIQMISLLICDYFGLELNEIYSMNPKKFIRYTKKIIKLFNQVNKKPFWVRIKFETEAKKITLGQFIEVQHFLKDGQSESLHLVGASIWDDKRDHVQKAELISNMPANYVLNDIMKFINSFNDLINLYKGLFEIQEEIQNSEIDEIKNEIDEPHEFISKFGWFFSAKQIAAHEGIKLEDAYNLPIVQALNDLAYLKSEQSYKNKKSK
jgi:hypothetical protein